MPTLEFPPDVPFTCQVTAVLLLFETVAVNCCVPPICTLAVAGESATETIGGGGDGAVLDPPPHAIHGSITRLTASRAAGTQSSRRFMTETSFGRPDIQKRLPAIFHIWPSYHFGS